LFYGFNDHGLLPQEALNRLGATICHTIRNVLSVAAQPELDEVAALFAVDHRRISEERRHLAQFMVNTSLDEQRKKAVPRTVRN